MPCNIGYSQTFKAKVARPQPQNFRASAPAPRIDRDLLDRIGVDDPDFLAWLEDLSVRPLLEAALERLRPRAIGLSLSLGADGALSIEGKEQERARADAILARWSFEVMAIVAEVLGYETRVSDAGLTAQKPGETAECFTVTREAGDVRLRFEHFKSRPALHLELRKFIALARKLGVPIHVDLDDGDDGWQAGGNLQAQPQ